MVIARKEFRVSRIIRYMILLLRHRHKMVVEALVLSRTLNIIMQNQGIRIVGLISCKRMSQKLP
jgi:hypothetical protein